MWRPEWALLMCMSQRRSKERKNVQGWVKVMEVEQGLKRWPSANARLSSVTLCLPPLCRDCASGQPAPQRAAMAMRSLARFAERRREVGVDVIQVPICLAV